MKHASRILSVTLLPVLLGVHAQAAPTPADPAAVRGIAPPAGLYRQESTYGGDMALQRRELEASGRTGAGRDDYTVSSKGANGQATTMRQAAQAPQTICIGPATDTHPFLKRSGCTQVSSTVADGMLTTISQCPGSQVTTAIRKTGPVTWEIRTRIFGTGAPATPAVANGGFRAVLAYAAKHAPTAAERAKAAKGLADYDADIKQARGGDDSEPELDADADAPVASPAAGGGARKMQVEVVNTLTRIGGSCKP